MKGERAVPEGVPVTFDERRGYVGTLPDGSKVAALSLAVLRRIVNASAASNA